MCCFFGLFNIYIVNTSDLDRFIASETLQYMRRPSEQYSGPSGPIDEWTLGVQNSLGM